MILELYWTDVNKNKYLLGKLYKDGEEYVFEQDDELKNAIRHGCFGIGQIDITKKINRSKELFTFFKNRIPPKNEIEAQSIIKDFNLEKYDELEMLAITKGKKIEDRYFLVIK